MFLLSNLPSSLTLISKSNHLSLAKDIAIKQIEDKRSILYTNLANGTTSISDSRLNSIPHATGNIVISDCSVAICTSSEQIKKITVTINWKDNNKDQRVTLSTFIGEGGINQ